MAGTEPTGIFAPRPFPKPDTATAEPTVQARAESPEHLGQLINIPLLSAEQQAAGGMQPVQAKLTIGQPGDKYEQEADQMAAKVMRMPEPSGAVEEQTPASSLPSAFAQPKPFSQAISPIQRQGTEHEEDKELAQPKPIQRQAATEEEEDPTVMPAVMRQADMGKEKEEDAIAPKLAIQRQAEPEEEPKKLEDTAQLKPMLQRASVEEENNEEDAIAPKLAIQRQADPEEEKEEPETLAQTKPLLQRAMPDEEEDKEPVSPKLQRRQAAVPEEEDKDPLQTKPQLQRETLPQEEDKTLQAKPQNLKLKTQNSKLPLPSLQAKDGAPQAPANFENQLAQHKGSGHPLSEGTRTFMEPRFGSDFSNVRVHETPDLANSIQAQAFTHGQDIYFNSGKYNPGSSGGKELLAHELTHVVQQTKHVAAFPLRRQLKPQSNKSTDRVAILCKEWNVREQPLRSSSKLGTLTYGDKVPLKRQINDDWLEVTYLSKTGFVYKKPWIKIQRAGESSEDTSATGYVGLNPEAYKEASALEKNSKDEVHTSLNDPQEHINYDSTNEIEKFIVFQLGVTKKHPKFQKILNCLEECDPNFREQMADLVKIFRSAELGHMKLERLVLSGHHSSGVMLGDAPTAGLLVPIRDLNNLSKAFSGAAGQIEDVMFSACNSKEQVELCKQIFPNLKSIWVYEGYSPSIKQGSARHITNWERKTRGHRVPKKSDAAGNIAIWTDKDGFL